MKCLAALVLSFGLASTGAQALDVGSDGSDGALNVTQNTVIDLGLATTGTWDTPGNGSGVYDPEKWAVVFKYSSVNIQSGKTVSFINHPSDAPVVWLVSGNVTIAGTVTVKGEDGFDGEVRFAKPGPGGFRGGRRYASETAKGSGGFGPGGAGYQPGDEGCAGAYATNGGGAQTGQPYGNARILPLIGGSGGSGIGKADRTFNGGAGGGAILIAGNGDITVTGTIDARGGNGLYGNWSQHIISGAGSGGGIRIIANSVLGNASGLTARGGGVGHGGGAGRIRIEANTINLTGGSDPNYTLLSPLENDTAVIWPPEATPAVKITAIAGQPVPDDPHAEFSPPGDVFLTEEGPVTADIEAHDLPLNWNVKVRVTLRSGDEYVANATFVQGDATLSTWSASLQALPLSDFVAIQARASRP